MATSTDYSGKPLSVRVVDFMPVFFFFNLLLGLLQD